MDHSALNYTWCRPFSEDEETSFWCLRAGRRNVGPRQEELKL